ncbi:hypothetical protein EK21DRAFT_70068 [Setomelanomma holmii]|uniref:Zn(2)-C6 fungal-type domain-containing protein n=1 Tax=Setomelanomma holmii TaxID=210430 RepID=A0A9P4H591_9PLEO|nr:hypothetical protein EK21DRAFT_70068 [Setomelanomma holmii]
MAEQRVAKRKTHTKSRKGCWQCKQRHTKCNEEKPRCANCSRLDIQCTWPASTNSYSASPHPSPNGHASPVQEHVHSCGSPGITEATDVFELSIPDMRLLHHWTARGYLAMHPHPSRKSAMFQTTIIELGFEHPFLLHGLLALSAVHKASFLLPGDRQELLQQADIHISQALNAMREHLEKPSDETAVPMFVLSSVLLTYNFGSVQEMPEDPIHSLHHCFMLLNGIKVVIGPHWDELKEDPILAQMTEMSTEATLQGLDELATNDTRPDILRLMDLTELVLDTHDKTVCIEAIQELYSVALRVQHIPPDRDVNSFLFLWAARITNRFLELLAAHNPVACIVTVHFAALLAQAGPVWWVVKWPRYLLFATRSLLAVTPDLLGWLDWPQSIIDSAPWTASGTPTSS